MNGNGVGDNRKPIRLTLPIPPSANRYWRHAAVKSRKRGFIVTTYVSEEAKAYKDALRLALLSKGVRPMVGAVKLTVRYFRPMRSGDLGNRLKVVEDMLEGVAYINDNQIAEIEMFRRTDPARPRLEVDILPIPDPDVYDPRAAELPFS
jgi:Holliday junction resolvase RusA-like endonuclease